MINKIKDLVKISEQIKEIKEKTINNTNEIKRLSEELKEFSSIFESVRLEMQKIQQEQREALLQLNKSLAQIKESNDDFKKEIYNFTILKRDIQKQVLDKFEEELKRQLIGHCEELKSNAKEYNEMKEKIKDIVLKSAKISAEMEKISQIAQNIKAEDFELKKYADVLRKNDEEKLKLLRQIDSLERLVSSLRRQTYNQSQIRRNEQRQKF